MENITKEIQKEFCGKYSFLKLLEVKYDASGNSCTVVFMYPETINRLKDEEENEIRNFLVKLFGLEYVKLLVAFKKSFLDEPIIATKVLAFLKENYASFATGISQSDIETEKISNYIKVTIALNQQQFFFYKEKNLNNGINEFLHDNFCGEFVLEPQMTKTVTISSQIASERQQILASESSNELPRTKIPRYEVVDPVVLFGKEIVPKPEFVQNIASSKERVIIAGTIENLQEKTFTAKHGRKNKEGQFPEKKFVSFVLKDPSEKIRCVYFCPKSNEKKLSKLANGVAIIVIADVEVQEGKRSCVVREISFCTLKKVEKKDACNFVLASHEYSVAFPKPYSSKVQVDIFSRKKIPNEYLAKNTFVVFDCETTGLEADRCEIVEIGAAKVVNGTIVETFQTLVCPEKPISAEITAINGIDNFMVKNSPKIDDAIKDFALFSMNCIMVAHNLPFDIKFVQNAGRKFGILFDNEKLDTLTFVKSKLNLSNYKLGTIVKELKIELTNAHRALFDAIATAEVLIALNQTAI